MRIDRLCVEQFGPLSACDASGLSPGLNIMVAPEPASAAACRDFIATTLFGSRASSNPAGEGRLRPAGVPGGGILELVDGEGIAITVERYDPDGGAAGRLAISRAGEPAVPGALRDWTGGLNQALYDLVFELDIEDLLAPASELEDRLVSAVSGFAGAGLPAALAALAAGRAAAWDRLAHLTADRASALRSLQEAQAELDEYERLSGRAAEISRQMASTAERLTPVRGRIDRLERLARSRGAWGRMQDIQRRMVEMPKLPYLPDAPIELLDRLEARRNALQEEMRAGDLAADDQRRELEDRQRALQDLPPVEQARWLWVQEADYTAAVTRLPVLERRLAEGEARLKSELAAVAPEWSEASLDDVDDSPATAGRLVELDRELERARDAAAAAVDKEEEAVVAIVAARDAVGSAERHLGSLGEPPELTLAALESRADAIERARGACKERDAAGRAVAEALARLASTAPKRTLPVLRLIPLVQMGLSIGFIATGIVTWGLALAAGDGSVVRTGQVIAATGLVGVALSVAVLRTQRTHSRRETEAAADSLREIARALGQLRALADTEGKRAATAAAAAAQLLEQLDLAPETPVSYLESESARVAREAGRRAEHDRAVLALDEARTAFERASAAGDSARLARLEADGRVSALRAACEDQLRSAGLPAGVSPASAATILSRAPALRALRSEVRDLRARLPLTRLTIERVEQGLRQLSELTTLPDFEPGGAAPVLAGLAERYRVTGAVRDKVGALRRAVQSWPPRRARLERELAAVEQKRGRLLELAGAADGEEFRATARGEQERRALSDELQELRRTAHDLTGPEGRELEEELRASAPDELHAELAGLRDRRRSLEDLQDRLQARLDEIDARRRQLADRPRTVEIRMEIDRLVDESGDVARRWAVRAIAGGLMAAALSDFRRDRQPGRLRTAGSYMERLSGGQYVGFSCAPAEGEPGLDAIKVLAGDGDAVPASRLPRSGLEQACAAVWMAGAQDRVLRTGPVPVMIGDLPGRFGPEAAGGVASAVAELSRATQVFLFTDRRGAADVTTALGGGLSPRVVDLGKDRRQLPLSA